MDNILENELIELYQNGDDQQKQIASNQLWNGNIEWIKKYVKTWMKGKKGITFDDLLNEACVGFMQAVKSFDIHHENNPRLITHAAIWIRGTLIRYIREHMHAGYNVPRCFVETRNMIRAHRSNRQSLSQCSVSIIAQKYDIPEHRVRELEIFFFINKHTTIEKNDCLLNLEKKCAKQDDEESRVKKFISGFVRNQPETIASILQDRWLIDKKRSYKKLAKEFGISYEQVRQHEIKAFANLTRQLEINHLV